MNLFIYLRIQYWLLSIFLHNHYLLIYLATYLLVNIISLSTLLIHYDAYLCHSYYLLYMPYCSIIYFIYLLYLNRLCCFTNGGLSIRLALEMGLIHLKWALVPTSHRWFRAPQWNTALYIYLYFLYYYFYCYSFCV